MALSSSQVASPRLPQSLRFFEPTIRRLRLADPLLMSAAIAYNLFFAIIPIAIAFVAWVSIVGRGDDGLARLSELLSNLPPDIAQFILEVVDEAGEVVESASGIWIIIALLIALYSGSRGIYAVQKAIRSMQGLEETRPYWITRGLGIAFTLGAGIALVVGYLIVLLGTRIASVVDEWLGLTAGAMEWVTLPVLAAWMTGLFYAIYRWGTPRPIRGSLVASATTVLLLFLGSWLANIVLDSIGLGRTVSILGTVGVLLVWMYYGAFVVVSVPALVEPLWLRFVVKDSTLGEGATE